MNFFQRCFFNNDVLSLHHVLSHFDVSTMHHVSQTSDVLPFFDVSLFSMFICLINFSAKFLFHTLNDVSKTSRIFHRI
jgi:hypothetical protein